MRRFRQLSALERSLLLHAALTLAVARILLPVLPLKRVRRIMRRLLPAVRPVQPCDPQRIAWAIRAVSRRLPFGATCLVSALAGLALFERYGYDAQMRIGVKRDLHRTFSAHAWLEQQGRIVLGGPAAAVETYQPMPDVEHLLR